MENLIKKFGRGFAIAGMSMFLFYGCVGQSINLKGSQKVTSINETRSLDKLLIDMDWLEKGLRKDIFINEEDMFKVFYGATGNDEVGIGVSVFRDITKGLNERGNFYFLVDYFDRTSRDYLSSTIDEINDEYEIIGIAESFNLKHLLKTLDEMPKHFEASLGEYRGFSVNIKDNQLDEHYKDVHVGETYYLGLRYENKSSGKVENLILTLKIKKGSDITKDLNEISFECYGNGKKTIQKSF